VVADRLAACTHLTTTRSTARATPGRTSFADVATGGVVAQAGVPYAAPLVIWWKNQSAARNEKGSTR
jgi:hypothetical protein